MKYPVLLALILGCHVGVIAQVDRAPAYPLLTHDPYFSVWSFNDTIGNAPTRHWTGKEQPLMARAVVDGETWHLLGAPAPVYSTILPTAENAGNAGRKTHRKPAANWYLPDFKDQRWEQTQMPLSSEGGNWKEREVWTRQEFNWSGGDIHQLFLQLRHDDDADVYLNGVKIFSCAPCYNGGYEYIPITAALHAGRNVLAMHGVNTGGPGYLDAGIVDRLPAPAVQRAEQIGLKISATQTRYKFRCGPVHVDVNFLSPLLMKDLERLSSPVSYVTFSVVSTDGNKHDVELSLIASTDLTVNTPAQEVRAEQISIQQMLLLKAGTTSQSILRRKGDDVRIDWGYLYIGVPGGADVSQQIITPDGPARSTSVTGTSLALETTWKLHQVGNQNNHRVAVLAYDDIASVQYFGDNRPAYWKSSAATMEQRFPRWMAAYFGLRNASNDFDEELYTHARESGGEQYAKLCVMAYRQAIAAHKLTTSPEGELLFLSKENFSNGSINTVDVTYPSAPLFLIYNSKLMEGMLNGIFYYSESGKWTKPFAAHDLGTYPLANGQTYPEDMPVEESGN
ncbi:MAG: DUF4965 domain-containing protein, partial [Cyclobacteriaceae bacterium]